MKEKDLQAVNELYDYLKDTNLVDEALFSRFEVAVANFNAEIQKRKDRYNANPELYRNRTKQWRVDNADRKASYQKSMFKGIMSKRKSELPAKKEGGNKVDKLTILIDMDEIKLIIKFYNLFSIYF